MKFKINFSIFLFAFLSVCLIYCSSSISDKQASPQYASLSDSTYYAGMESCAGCHRDVYETYIQTGMGKSFEVASKKKSVAEFSSRSLIHDPFKNIHYHPYWDFDSLCLKEFRLNGSDTVYSRVEKISFIIGSGQHTNSHMTNVNGYLHQAPATFYTQKGVWDLPPGFEDGNNSRFSRKIELECMSCHNAYPEMVAGSENKYSFVANGIDCERCHGPGSKHIEEKKKGNLVDITKQVDYTIVNPAKLPIALQLDICQRCHIQGNAVLTEGKTFFDFRPAMHLSDVMNVFMPVYKGQENEHIMASHAERMKMSKCFTASVAAAEKNSNGANNLYPYKNAMTCVTCHNPHVSVKVTENDVFNTACKSCHVPSQAIAKKEVPGSSTRDCSENKSARIAAKNNCVSCHMPGNSTIDIPHVRTTDHYIRKPIALSTVHQIKEFIGIACINNPGVDEVTKGKAYLSYYEKFDPKKAWLDSAKKYLPDQTDSEIKNNFSALTRWAFLKGDYGRVIFYVSKAGDASQRGSQKKHSNEDAWTAYRIGESYTRSGNDAQALVYFQKSVDRAPFIPEFRNKLGSSQLANNNVEEAKQNFEFIIRENPQDISAYVNLGYLTLTVYQDIAGADKLYDKALSLDPDNEQALLNKAGTQVFLNRPAEARKLLLRILAGNPSNLRAKQLLKTL